MPNRAATIRLCLLALDVLDEAYAQARSGPIERTALHRLALGNLLLAGVATPVHVGRIWAILGHEGTFEQLSAREAHFGTAMQGIRDRVRGLG